MRGKTKKDEGISCHIGTLTGEFFYELSHRCVNKVSFFGLVAHSLSPILVLNNNKCYFPWEKKGHYITMVYMGFL